VEEVYKVSVSRSLHLLGLDIESERTESRRSRIRGERGRTEEGGIVFN
jgi:hypothetical protein